MTQTEEQFYKRLAKLKKKHKKFLSKKNRPSTKNYNGIYQRYKQPVLTAAHTPLHWRFDMNYKTNPFLMQRIGVNATLNSGAIYLNGKYAFYTRPQDGFIEVGGGGIGWALVNDITKAEAPDEKIIGKKIYHTIKELKNGQGHVPIKTAKGRMHLAHGVSGCAAGLRYVLFMFMTDLDELSKIIARPGGYFMAPEGDERVGDVSNVLFANGWIRNEKDEMFIYYGSSDTRMHVATTTVEQLIDYCLNTPEDGLHSAASVKTINELIDKNRRLY